MKKSEFKKILKPLIKECIKECIFEEGVLSNIVTEVANGMASRRLVAEGITVAGPEEPDPEELKKKAEAAEAQRQERIRRLNESMSFGEVNVFEGTTTIPAETTSQGALSGVNPRDSGVDISAITKIAGGSKKWKTLIGK